MNDLRTDWEDEHEPLARVMHLVLTEGLKVPDRTGTGTLELFATSLYYPMHGNLFPLCTLKCTSFKNILAETLWLISGESKIDMLHKLGATHWDPWLPKDERFGKNDLGRVYGVQWRHWTSMDPGPKQTDQLKNLVDEIRRNPHGRRHLVTCWNPGELDQMALPPCHVMFQVHVGGDERLSLAVTQRSVDLFIGAPYDVGIYGLILRMLCCILGYAPGMLVFNFGSSHLYLNHLEQAQEMIQRDHKPFPTLRIQYRNQRYLEDFVPDDFTLTGYDPHPAIKAPVAV